MGGEQGTDNATDAKSDRKPDQPAHGDAMAALIVIAHAGQAGRHHLRNQRYALRNVLVLAENEDQQRYQNPAAGDSEKARGEATDPACHQTAKDIGKIHPRPPWALADGGTSGSSAPFASFHNASISASEAPSSERPLAANARSI